MRNSRASLGVSCVRMTHAVILFWVGPYRMGIEALMLKEIRNDEGRSAKELGCEAILSLHDLLGVPDSHAQKLLVLRPGRLAVRVDCVDRMIEIAAVRPLPRAFQGAERNWYRGYSLEGEIVVPILNPEHLEREAQELLTAQSMCAGVEPRLGEKAGAP